MIARVIIDLGLAYNGPRASTIWMVVTPLAIMYIN